MQTSYPIIYPAQLTYPTVPPAGVYAVAGCGADFLINILLTCLGYVLPQPHIHSPSRHEKKKV
jgi:hypothetical protein